MSKLTDEQLKSLASDIIGKTISTLSTEIITALRKNGVEVSIDSVDKEKLLSKGKRKLILQNPHSPGDIVMMTAAIRDLHATYPGEYVTDVDTPCPEIFEGNPFITRLDRKDPDVAYFKAEYPLIHESNEGSYHFIHGYRKHLEEAIGRPIKQGKMKGDIYIREEEKYWIGAVETAVGSKIPYWIIDARNSGLFQK